MCLGFCGPHDVHVLMPPVVTQKQPQPIHKEEGVVVIPTGQQVPRMWFADVMIYEKARAERKLSSGASNPQIQLVHRGQ